MEQFSFNLTLSFDDENCQVRATLIPEYNLEPLTKQKIILKLQEQGYGDYFRFDDHIEELLAFDQTYREQAQKILEVTTQKLKKVNKGTERPESDTAYHLSPDSESTEQDKSLTTEETQPAIAASQIFAMLSQPAPELIVAEKRDAEICLDTDELDLKAYLTITRPFGGEAASLEDVQAFLENSGVQTDIDIESITRATEIGQCDSLLIAQGTKAKKGMNSRFEKLISAQISSGPTIDEKGNANYHDINQFVVVEPGDHLMKRLPPTQGKNGVDVFGKVIPAEPGEELPFSSELEGSEVSQEDPNLLVASIKGHPIIQEHGVSIDTVLVVKNASLATGNIDFDGSVCVEEDVADGISIKAVGDVTVKGTVGKANIEAGNDISIHQGLIGGTKTSAEMTYGALLKAGKKISVKFASYSKLEAGDEIEITEYASHCGLYAENRIIVGYESGTGSLNGGQARAFQQILAKSIGSTGGTPTDLRIGADADTILELRTTSQKMHKNRIRLAEIAEALNKLAIWAKVAGINEQTKEKIENLNNEQILLNQEIEELEKQAEAIKKLLLRTKKSKVSAKHKIFPNVTVSILNVSYKTKDEMGHTHFRFENKRVLLEH